MIHLPEHVVTIIRALGVMVLVIMWLGVGAFVVVRAAKARETEPGEFGTSWHRELPINTDQASDE